MAVLDETATVVLDPVGILTPTPIRRGMRRTREAPMVASSRQVAGALPLSAGETRSRRAPDTLGAAGRLIAREGPHVPHLAPEAASLHPLSAGKPAGGGAWTRAARVRHGHYEAYGGWGTP